jgi:hypothetical protein
MRLGCSQSLFCYWDYENLNARAYLGADGRITGTDLTPGGHQPRAANRGARSLDGAELTYYSLSGLCDFLPLIHKGQSGGVKAETQPGGGRTVIENMAQMGSAARAEDLGAMHAKAVVVSADDIFLGDRLEETGPPGARIKFRIGSEQRKAAADAVINTFAMVVEQRPAKRRLGTCAARDLELFRGKLFAPLGVTLLNLRDRDGTGQGPVRPDQPDGYRLLGRGGFLCSGGKWPAANTGQGQYR